MAPLRRLAGIRACWLWVASIVVGALLVAACGSSSSSSRSPSAAAGTSSASSQSGSTGAKGAAAEPVTNYLNYVGGKAGAANSKLAPITIGFINQQGGPPSESFPQATVAAQAAAKMINTELGGVHGHPVKLVTCFIASTEAEGSTCGQKMAADKAVKAITTGLYTIGNSSIYNVLKGSIPIVLGVSANPADDTAKNVFELEGSSTSATAAFGTFIKQAYPQAKTVAIAYQNQVGTVAIAQGEKAGFSKAGLSVKLIPYSPTTTDLTGPATQMEQADIAAPACGFIDCPLMDKAITQLGESKPAISTPLWTYLPPAAYTGKDLPHWVVGSAAANLAYTADSAVRAYKSESAKNGLPASDQLNVFASFAWTNMTVLDKVLNEIPLDGLTPSAVAAKLKAFKGTIPLGPPGVDCSGTVDPAAPAVCNDEAQFFQYEGHGGWKQVAGFLKPPG
jgi:branched-chain amino acid transport system substrate-binding protein